MSPAERTRRSRPRRADGARAPEANGRPALEHRPTPGRTTGDWAKLAGRVVLWALVVILLLRGLASVVRPAPEPLAPAPSPEATAIRDDEARAYAAAFAKRYLTYDVARPDERERWLAPYLAEDLDPAGGVEIPEVGSNQRVEDTDVARVRPNGPGRLLVTVATTVASPTLSTRYLTVPIQRDASGGLLVYDYPSFEAAPARADAPAIDTRILPAEEREAIEDVLRRFLTAYLAGREGALAYFLPPGRELEAVGERYVVEELEDVKSVGPEEGPQRTVVAVVRARDKRTRAAYLLRYQAVLVYRDRWLVARVNSL